MVQPKPWDGVNTRRGQSDSALRLNSSRHHDSQRLAYSYPHSTNSGAGQPAWGRKRCHRDSIGSGEDTSGSEGVATPSTNEELHPGIVGEGTAEVDEPHMVRVFPQTIVILYRMLTMLFRALTRRYQ